MVKSKNEVVGNTSLAILLLYLFLSILSSLLFCIFYFRAVNKGNAGIGWFILTLVCAIFYGVIAYSLVVTSSPSKDAGYYYLGVFTIFTNSLALLLLFGKLLVPKK
jgi:hypothetical protein